MNRIIIETPQITGRRIDYRYEVEGDWRAAFRLDESFFIEYSCDIANVPEGIAVVPLLCNILPMAWVYDAEIVVPCVDKAFYESVREFKRGYEEMYPSMEFLGTLTAGDIQENLPKNSGKTAAFFSGGVDAFNTLIQHMDERPTLLTLWGADVSVEDVEGWANVEKHLQETAETFAIEAITIKSSFRRFLNERELHQMVYALSGDGWWHGFQHGIGIISHGAPAAYAQGFSTLYFASSFTIAEKGKVTCASDPTIDNFLRFGATRIIHDGYEFCRQDKVHNIVSHSRETGLKAPLRVCWVSTGGQNCCMCEKCWRTMVALYAEKVDPREYGFVYSDRIWKKITNRMKRTGDSMFGPLRYATIQRAMRQNCTIREVPKELRWFYRMPVEKLGRMPLSWKILRFGKRLLKRILSA